MKFTNLMGTNGTGKSTRTTFLVEFLDKNYSYKELTYSFLKATKTSPEPTLTTIENIGRVYSNGMLIVGRLTQSGKWVGLDTADLNNWASKIQFYKYIIENSKELGINHIIQEGYFNNKSLQGSPNVIKQLGFESADFIVFSYNNVNEFLERCSGRAGKNKGLEWAMKSSGWNDNKAFVQYYEKYKLEESENFNVVLLNFDAEADYLVNLYFNQN